jgi:hypothetical protein
MCREFGERVDLGWVVMVVFRRFVRSYRVVRVRKIEDTCMGWARWLERRSLTANCAPPRVPLLLQRRSRILRISLPIGLEVLPSNIPGKDDDK